MTGGRATASPLIHGQNMLVPPTSPNPKKLPPAVHRYPPQLIAGPSPKHFPEWRPNYLVSKGEMKLFAKALLAVSVNLRLSVYLFPPASVSDTGALWTPARPDC